MAFRNSGTLLGSSLLQGNPTIWGAPYFVNSHRTPFRSRVAFPSSSTGTAVSTSPDAAFRTRSMLSLPRPACFPLGLSDSRVFAFTASGLIGCLHSDQVRAPGSSTSREKWAGFRAINAAAMGSLSKPKKGFTVHIPQCGWSSIGI